MRSLGDNYNNANFSYNGNDSYYFWMVNGTQGMNAIHITNVTSNFYGGVYNNQSTYGTFYVSSTDGHHGVDDVLLLVAVNSSNSTDLSNFAIHLDVSGYNWAPLEGADAPPFEDGWTIEDYNDTYYNASTIDSLSW